MNGVDNLYEKAREFLDSAQWCKAHGLSTMASSERRSAKAYVREA